MKGVWLAVVLPALCLGACNKPKEARAETADVHGRFAGIGIYSTDRMWSQLVGAEAPKSPAAARLQDDREVIVVVDTRTGEIRQCGNLSGYCVGMSPWAKPLSAAQVGPLSISKHQEELQREDEQAAHAAAAAKSAGKP